jgi:hypothetical protein
MTKALTLIGCDNGNFSFVAGRSGIEEAFLVVITVHHSMS